MDLTKPQGNRHATSRFLHLNLSAHYWTSLQERFEARVRVIALIGFFIAVILAPLRFRFTLVSRPAPPIYPDYTDFLLFASDLALVVSLALWFLSLALCPRRLRLGPVYLSLPILFFPILGLLTAWNSPDPPLTIYHAGRLLMLVGMFLFVSNEVKSLRIIVIPVAIQLLVQAGVGVAQTLAQHSIGLARLGELELDPAWSGVSIVWAEGARSLRAYGLSDHPNILGGCLAFALLVLAFRILDDGSPHRLVFSSLFCLGCLALLFTFSRSAWLAFCGGLLLIAGFLTLTRRKTDLVSLGSLLLAVLLLLAPFIWDNLAFLGNRLNAGGSFSRVGPEIQAIGERQMLNAATNEIFMANALTGVGLGALPLAMRAYFPDLPVDYQPAHVALFTASAELGILGGLLYTIALFGPWLALILNRRRLVFSPALIYASGLLLAVTIVGLFDYYTWLLAPGRFWQWMAWGLWAAIYQASQKRAQR
jgi:hypothetical protein